MTWQTAIALFGALVVLAALPSVSVLAVVSRAAAAGWRQGAWVALGIVAGDAIWLAIALGGLAVALDSLAGTTTIIKYVGAVYLFWVGVRLWRSPARTATAAPPTSRPSSLLTGLAITLADQKAALFYLSFLPAFLDLSQVTLGEAGAVVAIALVAVGSVKLAYAVLAARALSLFRPRVSRRLNQLAGGLTIAAGLWLLVKVG